jgi:transposase
VIALAQQGGVTQLQIAEDFRVSKSALATWLQKAEVHERGLVRRRLAVQRMMRRRYGKLLKRICLLEQEAAAMRRAVTCLSQAQPPKRCTRWSVTLPRKAPRSGCPSWWPAGCSPSRSSATTNGWQIRLGP